MHVPGYNIIGEVKGKRCIMIDDMIDTARTITLGAQALMDAMQRKFMLVVRILFCQPSH